MDFFALTTHLSRGGTVTLSWHPGRPGHASGDLIVGKEAPYYRAAAYDASGAVVAYGRALGFEDPRRALATLRPVTPPTADTPVTVARLGRALALADRAITALMGGTADARSAALEHLEAALGLSTAIAPHFDRVLTEDLAMWVGDAYAGVESGHVGDLRQCIAEARQISDELTSA